MTHVIVVADQKGGIGKTTVATMLASILSSDAHERVPAAYQRKAEKVLLVDVDFQGDATAQLTRMDRGAHETSSLHNALQTLDAAPYIVRVTDTLHVLPASSQLALFETWFTLNVHKLPNAHKMLNSALEGIYSAYDWVILDTSPSLSQLNLQALNVTLDSLKTNVIIPLQTESYGLESAYSFSDTLLAVSDKTNPQLRILGIVPILADNMALDRDIIKEAQEAFGPLMMQTVIKRRSEIKKMGRDGFSEHYSKQREALQDFYQFVKEVRARVQ